MSVQYKRNGDLVVTDDLLQTECFRITGYERITNETFDEIWVSRCHGSITVFDRIDTILYTESSRILSERTPRSVFFYENKEADAICDPSSLCFFEQIEEEEIEVVRAIVNKKYSAEDPPGFVLSFEQQSASNNYENITSVFKGESDA